MKWFICFVGAVILWSVAALPQAAQTPPDLIGPCWVIKVKDGDSLKVRLPEREPMDIRYMGVNAPELDDEDRLGPVAKERNEDIVGQASVWLELERKEQGFITDRDGRVLAYVLLEKTGTVPVQAELIREGLALLDLRGLVDRELSPGAFSIRYADQLIAAQIEAAFDHRGLWALPEFFPGRDLAIAAVKFWGDMETVWILNRGAVPIELAENWVLKDRHAIENDDSRNVLEFEDYFGPSCTLPPGGLLEIYTGPDTPQANRGTCSRCGTDQVELWWFGYKVWDNTGDEALLFAPDGEQYFRYTYPPLNPEEKEED